MKLGRRCKPKHEFVRGVCVNCHIPQRGTPERYVFDFWRHVKKTPTCWIWLGARTYNGYGQVRRNNKLTVAHRLSWLLTGHEDPGKLDLHHTCKVRHCVKPSHLKPLTHSQHLRMERPFCKQGHLLEGNRFVSGNSSRCAMCYAAKLAEARFARAVRKLKRSERKAMA